MTNCKKTMLILLSTATVPGGVLNADAASWRMIPAITLTETYADNVDLDSSVQQSDFVTQVEPEITITARGTRLNMSLFYAPSYFYYPGDNDDKHDLRHNLQANLSSELVSEALFIDGGASISQQFLDRRRAISSVDVDRTDNRQTVQAYYLSPYLLHRFGSWVTAQLKYDIRHIRTAPEAQLSTTDTIFGNSLTHQGSFTLDSGRRFTKLNWSLLAQYRTEERENSPNFDTTTLRTDFSYQLTRKFALLGSVGYQRRDAVGSFSNFDGFIWDAGFRLVPGPRTSISFRYGNQNDGDTFSLDAQYKITASNVINLSYEDRIQTFQSFLFDDDSGVIIDPAQNTDFVSGDITRRKRWSLSLAGERGRTSYSVAAFYSKYRSDNTALDEIRYGGVISISRRLNRRLSVNGGFSYDLSKFSTAIRDDIFWTASANMSYDISKSLVGTLGYVHSDRDQARFDNLNGGSNYVSLSIRAAL